MEVLRFLFCHDFVANTQNPLIHNPRFEGFSIPSLDDFVGGDRDGPSVMSHQSPQELLVAYGTVPF